MKIPYKKICDNAFVPSYGTEFSAGADLFACMNESLSINPGETKLVHTGICIAIPQGYVGLIFARSGLATKKGLAPANKVGVIDADYRGEIMVPLFNQSKSEAIVSPGDRIAQIIFMPYVSAAFEETDELKDTERGEKGFGSTGR